MSEAKQDSAPTVEAATLAKLFGLTPTRISQLGKSGVLPKANERGKYLLWPSIKNYIAELKNPKLNRYGRADGGGDEPETLRIKRERKIDLECAKLNHQVKVMEGEYISRESQIQAGLMAGQAIKQLILKIPAELPQALLGLDYSGALQKCEDYAHAMLTEISSAETYES
jgi:hypothetical protein